MAQLPGDYVTFLLLLILFRSCDCFVDQLIYEYTVRWVVDRKPWSETVTESGAGASTHRRFLMRALSVSVGLRHIHVALRSDRVPHLTRFYASGKVKTIITFKVKV